jgi:hypothetical protein
MQSEPAMPAAPEAAYPKVVREGMDYMHCAGFERRESPTAKRGWIGSVDLSPHDDS